MNDRQTNYENAGAYEDLGASMCCLGASMAWRGESENESERDRA